MVDGQPFGPLEDGGSLRLAELCRLLDLPAREEAGKTLCVAVVSAGGMELGVVADGFHVVQDLPVEPLDEDMALHPALAGTAVLDDGRLVLTLSPAALLARAETVGEMAPAAAPSRPPTILVADDSVTTRTLEKSLLEAHGYDVVMAMDGRQALDILRSRPVDLVVSDVEMPHMDGFALLRAVKSDSSLHQVPVLLVTSRENDEDRQRGMELGADAYMVKRRFDHVQFLEAVARLT
jgi:two-component system chemotaxis sensor kinase CheA